MGPKGNGFVRLKRLVLWLIVSVLSLAAIGAIYQAIATQIDVRAYPAPGQMVAVGGFQMHLYCTGTNTDESPTVVLETGLGSTSAVWTRVQPEVAQTTRVCSYDRAGLGWSQPSPAPRDAGHIASELHTLLHKANVPGPYVLVGWSYGGLYVREYAAQYGEEVAGIVLLDSSHPDQWTSTPQAQAQFESNTRIYFLSPTLARLGVMRVIGLLQPSSGLPSPYDEMLRASFSATKDWETQSAEFLASPETDDQVRQLTSLGNMPLFVLSATEHGMPAELEGQWQVFQNELAGLSTNSLHQVLQRANHASIWRDPETVKMSIAAISQVVEAARTGTALK